MACGLSVRAMNNLGVCYKNGNGVPQDIHKAIELYERAAELGNVNAMVENTGNTHEQATVSLIVTDFFKGEEIFSTKEEGNSDFSEVIMPETKRFLTREIKNLPSLGIIKIEQTIKFNGDVSKEDGVVVIAPIWFIVLVLLTLSAIIAGIVFRVKAKLKQRSIKL